MATLYKWLDGCWCPVEGNQEVVTGDRNGNENYGTIKVKAYDKGREIEGDGTAEHTQEGQVA